MSAAEGREGWPLRSGLHLAVLCSLALAQPLFDLLGRNAAFFAIRGSAPTDIVVFAVALTVVPPLVLLAAEALAGLAGPRFRRALHLVLIGLLVAVVLLSLLKRAASASSGVLLPLALAAGAGGALLYARLGAARAFLTVLSPAPVIFLGQFVLASPVRDLVLERGGSTRVADVGGRAPVVVIVLDEFPVTSLLERRGRIDAIRYPNFAALARGSDWFPNTSTVDAFTQVAVPAIMTGRRPRTGQLPIAADHPDNIFTLLGRGHRLHVLESITHLCPRELCRERRPGFGDRLRSLASDLGVVELHLLLPDDLRRRLPSISSSWQNFGGGRICGSREASRPGAQSRPQTRPPRFQTGAPGRPGSSRASGRPAARGARRSTSHTFFFPTRPTSTCPTGPGTPAESSCSGSASSRGPRTSRSSSAATSATCSRWGSWTGCSAGSSGA